MFTGSERSELGSRDVDGRAGRPSERARTSQWVAELNAYDYRHRLYDPDLGRFLQTDPLGLQTEGAKLSAGQKALFSPGFTAPEAFSTTELNLYRYCGDDPVDNSDPTGLLWDVIADVGFIGYDIYKLVTEGGGQGGENWKALGLDTGAAFLPFATGAGVVYRAAKAGERLNAAAKAAESKKKIEKAAQAVENYLGGAGELKLNRHGDPVIMRGDKKVRVDANNPHGDKPHFHLEKRTESGKWKDAGEQHRYYLKKQQ